MRSQGGNIQSQKKIHRIICARGITAHPPSYVIFYHFFCLLPLFWLFSFLVEKNAFAPEIGGGRGAGASPALPESNNNPSKMSPIGLPAVILGEGKSMIPKPGLVMADNLFSGNYTNNGMGG